MLGMTWRAASASPNLDEHPDERRAPELRRPVQGPPLCGRLRRRRVRPASGPARSRSPHHVLPFNSLNKGL